MSEANLMLLSNLPVVPRPDNRYLVVDSSFLALSTELLAALLAAVEPETALKPGDAAAVAREVVVV